ncbi:MAG: Crp/Fnr family transcriptional regulator [Anaerolineae bacterium]|nr:Crp/Fnr family transcriptional regulator [Anaerolineae bacterium]
MSYTNLLRNVSLFIALSDDDFDALTPELLPQNFRRDQVIFTQGSNTNSLYIVRSGSVQVEGLSRDGTRSYVGVFGPDQYFGEFALLDGLPRSGEAVALQSSELLVLTRPAFFRFLDRRPSVASKMLVAVARRMRFAESALEHRLNMTPAQKIARLLLDVAGRYPSLDPNAPPGQIELLLTGDDLAALSGVARNTAGEIVQAMYSSGLIAVERAHIVAVDVEQLQAVLDGEGR